MHRSRRILAVVGTRPEAIKMAPVVAALRAADWVTTRVVTTGQHRELLMGALADFGLAADVDLALMQHGQGHEAFFAAATAALRVALAAERPDLALAQGDTTTVAAAARACHELGIAFGHVEAGLRTGDPTQPFPEEQNRVYIATVASLHFAPTAGARVHLLREGVDPATVHVTGNTGIDALLATAARLGPPAPRTDGRRALLVTAHRRESFGAPLAAICAAVRALAGRGDVAITWPVHPNPQVREFVQHELAGVRGVRLVAPLDHADMVAAMQQAHVILTDSGGVQEEAPSLGVPVLVLRDVTERPEGVAAGVARLVGTDGSRIVAETARLLDDPAAHAAMARVVSPYGDGGAAPRIVAALQAWFAARG
ncbi:MAG: UDP-N-acetylglucosamine 2-epimerase (non-hydrolyzing) [Planctomycetes bacterium]|nr:UDP-N-acetylglucosamine 2-epimerase (non-hydrolyzing) [Planctomycetota bacterium]